MKKQNDLEEKISSIVNEEERMPVLLELLEKERRNYADLGIKFAEELLSIAEKNREVFYQASALFYIGVAFEQKGNYPNAINQIREAKIFYNEAGKITEVILCHNLLAKIYSNLGDYTRALDLSLIH